MSRTALGALAFAVVLGLALASWPAGVHAHATLVRAEPAENAFLQRAPTEIILTFSETIDPVRSQITVLDSRGIEIVSGGTLVSEGLRLQLAIQLPGPGIYNVLWRNVSTVDGHELRGSYPFTVLNPDGSLPAGENLVATTGSNPDPPPKPDSVAVRALSLLGLVIIVAAAACAVIARVTARRLRFETVLLAGVVVLAAATVLQFVLLADVRGERGLSSLLTDTRLGQWWIVRAAAVAVIAAALAATRWPLASAAMAAAGAAVYLGGYTATSHAVAGTGAGWAAIPDYLHGVAAIAWIGGVTGLATSVRLGRADAAYRRVMPGFALVASLAVYVLLATGFLNSLALMGSADDLWTTRYGLTLIAKLGAALPLLGLAYYNSRRGRRLLESGRPGGERRFIRLAVAEAALGGLVLFGGAMLTQSTVAKNVFERPDDRPFDATTEAAGMAVRLQIDPNRTGLNTYSVTLTGPEGAPLEAQRVRLTFRYQDDQTVGPSTLSLARSGAGAYSGAGPYLTLEGNWRVEVEVRRPDVDDAFAFFAVRPAGAAVGIVRIGGTWANPAAALSWNEYVGFVALLVGLGVALFRGWLPRRPRLLALSANTAVVGLFGFGMLLLFGVHGHAPTGGLPVNPVFPDADSIERGRTIYQANCASCHGRAGVPPRGLDLDPYPLDLTVHVPQHPDGQIFLFIANGLPGTAMRAWSRGPDSLTNQEIWHVVNYLRTLGAVDR